MIADYSYMFETSPKSIFLRLKIFEFFFLGYAKLSDIFLGDYLQSELRAILFFSWFNKWKSQGIIFLSSWVQAHFIFAVLENFEISNDQPYQTNIRVPPPSPGASKLTA